MGPLLSLLHAADVGRIVEQHEVDPHFYDDDTQTYLSDKPTVSSDVGH